MFECPAEWSLPVRWIRLDPYERPVASPLPRLRGGPGDVADQMSPRPIVSRADKRGNDFSAPSVVLLRDPSSHTAAMYLERALAPLCNLKTVYVDRHLILAGGFRRLPAAVRNRIGWDLVRRRLQADSAFKRADLVIVVEPAMPGFTPTDSGCTTAFYAIDCGLRFRDHINAYHAAEFDYVFVSQRDYVERYRQAGCRTAHWLPLAYDPAIHRVLNLPATRNVTFVGKSGASPVREALIQALQESVGLEVHHAYLNDMVRVFNESRIVFNRSLDGLNMRVFEALGCGSFLLTDKCGHGGLQELFTPGTDLVTYEDVDDAIQLARHYLAVPEDRVRIAQEGHRTAEKGHTYRHRATEILRVALGLDTLESNMDGLLR